MQKNKCIISSEYQHLEKDLVELNDSFEKNQNDIYRGRNSLKEFSFDGKKQIIKSFRVPGILKKIIYAVLKSSKAQKSYHNAVALLAAEINTPNPIGFINYYQIGLLDKSYYICEKVDYDFTFHDVIQGKVEGCDKLLEEFADFTFDMHQKGFLHLDYTPGNIVITKLKDHFGFSLVDLNRMMIGSVSWQVGAECFGKIYFKKSDMQIVVDHYASLQGVASADVMKFVEAKHQRYERFKKFKQIIRFWRK